MNSTDQAVDFLSYQIDLIKDDDGNLYVPLKRLCEILGSNHNRQRREVKESGVYDWKMLFVKGADGRHRKMLCLPLKQACLWFYIVKPNTVRPEIKERLLEYQEESTTALRHSRQYGLAFHPRSPAEEIEGAVRESIDRIIEETTPESLNPRLRRHIVLRAELDLFGRFGNEAPPFKDKAAECIVVAIDRYFEWLIRHGNAPSYCAVP